MRHRVLTLFAAFWAFASQSSAVEVTDYTWISTGSPYWSASNNWDRGIVPNDIAKDRAIFGPSSPYTFVYFDEVSVYGLVFDRIKLGYYFSGDAGLNLGAGGIDYRPNATADSTIHDRVSLYGNQTWNIAQGTFVIDGRILDSFEGGTGDSEITKTGAGTLRLDSAQSNQWHGGLRLVDGRMMIAAAYDSTNYSLGDGTLTFAGGTLVASNFYGSRDEVVLLNHINSTGLISTQNDSALRFAANASGGGGITLSNDTTIKSTGDTLYIDGNIDETGSAKKLTISSDGAVVLDGTNTYSGGTHVDKGLLIFGNPDAVPQISAATNTITVSALGYAGYASTDDFNTKFLAHFNRVQTFGTIGFDTDPLILNYGGSPNVFTQNVNLAGQVPMLNARLGSATAAIFSGTLTPADGLNYRFGGGGGKLMVTSDLTGTGGLNLTSPTQLPLTLRLSGINTYQNGTYVEQSALIFDQAASLPATGSLSTGTGGYIGIAYTPVNGVTTEFLNRFTTLAAGSVVGFDSNDLYNTYREITDSIDFSAARFAGAYLGTSSNVGFSGTLTPNGSTYRFAGYKGGTLTLLSALGGNNAVVIGHPDVQGTIGDRNTQTFSTVYLANTANTYTGGTTLHPGHLIVGGDYGQATHALGTGALTVAGTNIAFDDGTPSAYLTPSLYGMIIPNAIILNSNLDVGGVDGSTVAAAVPGSAAVPTPALTLSGNISGTGQLLVGDETPVNLRLTGDNTFSGGIYVRGGSTLALGSNTATGTGLLSFGSASSSVYFETAAPVIGGLSNGDSYVTLNFTAPSTNLAITQGITGKFEGEFHFDAGNTFVLTKNGPGTLYLERGGIFADINNTAPPGAALPGSTPVALQVQQGALVLSSSFTLADNTSTVWVNGGTLVLQNGKSLENPLTVDNGGRLAGSGSFTSAYIGPGATLSPGFSETNAIGFLHFTDHLTLAGGGTYEWNIANPDPFNYAARDSIFVGSANTLEIAATASNRFTLKLISLDLSGQTGTLDGLTAAHGPYTWSLIGALSLTGSADFLSNPASVFNLDTTAFNTGGLAGTFSLSSANNNLLLTFTPVPEPSTYALMVVGLGFIGVTLWRRRRSS